MLPHLLSDQETLHQHSDDDVDGEIPDIALNFNVITTAKRITRMRIIYNAMV